jgi:hypothetical protein
VHCRVGVIDLAVLVDETSALAGPLARGQASFSGGTTRPLGGYCKSCKKPVQLDVRWLRVAALEEKGDIQAPYSDTLDRMWVDADHPPMYPPGTTRHTTDPR